MKNKKTFTSIYKGVRNFLTSEDAAEMAYMSVAVTFYVLLGSLPVAEGGLFCSLLRFTAPLGYDILTPREVRLDAFLFGEEPGRYLVAVDEQHDDQFLLKMDEARLNCCFLGRTTKNRILVDGYDFGPTSDFLSK